MSSTTFTHAGFNCKIMLTSMGHYCGYVDVPPGHPFFSKAYGDVVPAPKHIINRPVSVGKDVGTIPLFCATSVTDTSAPIDLLMHVHGGITYASKAENGKDWTFGFDCAHSDDGRKEGDPGWKDEAFVMAECRRLAEQLADVPKWFEVWA